MARHVPDWNKLKLERREASGRETTAFEHVLAVVMVGIFVVPLWLLLTMWRYRYYYWSWLGDDHGRVEGGSAIEWPSWVVGGVFWLVLVPIGIAWWRG